MDRSGQNQPETARNRQIRPEKDKKGDKLIETVRKQKKKKKDRNEKKRTETERN